ncbi:MAG TPA: SRPBCC domain-containing protein [Steroidobacteraceae bacterium]|nr:SRPBCC domain-containing protein [Steroidobacteraceae bacterium]
MSKSDDPGTVLSLVVRRVVRAAPQRVFDAWTRPEELCRWWGPNGVVCTEAHVDLRVGGRYRIANRFPDGKILWICGEYQLIEPPARLVYSWRIESRGGGAERVSVCFEACAQGTLVVVTHERIADQAVRERHEQGWRGCLDGLGRLLDAAALSG